MVQELADRAAIVDAAIAYATALDSRDWERLGALFTDDACWEYSGSAERLCGPGAIVARIRASLERFDATHHLNGNHVTAVLGDEAEHTATTRPSMSASACLTATSSLAAVATRTGCAAPQMAGGSRTAGSSVSGARGTRL
jgi:ketosteroid isomerase-like protein